MFSHRPRGLDYVSAANNSFLHETFQRQLQLIEAAGADPQVAQVTGDLPANGWGFYVRDLYLSATPVTGLTFEFGAIPIERAWGPRSRLTMRTLHFGRAGEGKVSESSCFWIKLNLHRPTWVISSLLTSSTATTVCRNGITTRSWERRRLGNV